MEITIKIDNRVGDKILLMSEAQYQQYLADPAAFLAWLERTGQLPEPEPLPVKRAVETVKNVTRRQRDK